MVIGSPPRVRGTVTVKVFAPVSHGITPACAGNRAGCMGYLCGFWDHPRVCGEQAFNLCLSTLERGSPPRVRGTGIIIMAFFGMTRITPACAGNSFRRSLNCWTLWDHPRVCGEQPSAAVTFTVRVGSPPRVRGTGIQLVRVQLGDGITPACAGNRRMPFCRMAA